MSTLNRCGKWNGAHATLPGQARDHLCHCQPVSNSRPLNEYLRERIERMTPEQLAQFVEARARIQESIAALPEATQPTGRKD